MPARTVIALGFSAILLIGLADFLCPPETTFAFWFLLACGWVGSGAGLRYGALAALLSTALQVGSEWLAIREGLDMPVYAWNTLTRLVFYFGAAWVSSEFARITRGLRTSNLEERRRADQRVEELEALHRRVLAHVPATMWMADENGFILYAGENIETLFGYPASDFQDKPVDAWLKVVHPDDRETAHQQLLKLFSTGDFDIQYRAITRDQRVIWVNSRSVLVFEKEGRKNAYGFAMDITASKRAQRIVETQRDLAAALSVTSNLQTALQAILNAAVKLDGVECGGVYLKDETGGVRMAAHRGVSEAFAKECEWFPPNSPPAEMTFRGTPIYAPHAEIGGKSKVVVGEGIRFLGIIPLRHEGSVVGCITVGSKIQETITPETRRVLELIGAQAAGALARIRVEAALRESETRLRSIVHGAPLIIFATDRQSRLTFLEGSAYGTRLEAQPNRPAREVFCEFPSLADNIQRALAGEEFTTTVEINSKVFECWHSPTRETSGAINGMICVGTNITERQRLERQLLEVTDHEQARIGQEIHDGLCQELVGVAFDANALQQTLRAENHAEAPTADRLAEYLDLAITQARQLSRGLFPIKLDGDGLPSALQELAANTSRRFRVKCRFQHEAPRGLNRRVAAHLFRVAQEAVTNAVKHSRADTILIRLETLATETRLHVEDNGVGFDGRSNGKGMGLHIMRYRARTIGGHIRITPASAGGTLVSCCVSPEKS